MSVKAPCVEKGLILPGAEHPPGQLRHSEAAGHGVSQNIFIMLRVPAAWGAYVYMGLLFM